MSNATTVTKHDRTRLVVINNYALGYWMPGQLRIGILASSALRGAPWTNAPEPVAVDSVSWRLASAQDFEAFRVRFDGYDNPAEYEYSTLQTA